MTFSFVKIIKNLHRAGTVYLSRTPEFTPDSIFCEVSVVQSSAFCVVLCISLFVLLPLAIVLSVCPFTDSTYPLVSSNPSFQVICILSIFLITFVFEVLHSYIFFIYYLCSLHYKEHKTQTAYHKYVDINNNRKIFILWTKQETKNQAKFVVGIWIERYNS